MRLPRVSRAGFLLGVGMVSALSSFGCTDMQAGPSVAPDESLQAHRRFAPIEGRNGELTLRQSNGSAAGDLVIERLAPTAQPERGGKALERMSVQADGASASRRVRYAKPFRPGEVIALRIREQADDPKTGTQTHFVYLKADDKGVAREIDWERFVCDGAVLECRTNEEGDREINIPMDEEE